MKTEQKMEVQVMEPTALSLQMKAEIDTQISTAKAFPRDLKKSVDDTLLMATFNEEIAQSCGYAVPRKKKKDDGTYDTVLIEGPSVRLAEIFFANYGNIRGGKRIVSNDGRKIVAQGVCHDVEKNIYYAVETEAKISYSDGKTYNEDLQTLIANAASSKAFRNAVFTVIPKAFVQQVYEKTREVMKGSAAQLKQNVEKALAFFIEKGVKPEQMFALLGKDKEGKPIVNKIEDITPDQLVMLRGMASLIKNGEGTLKDIINPAGEGDDVDLPSDVAMEILKFTDKDKLIAWANQQTEWEKNKNFQEAVQVQAATLESWEK